jgi:hypothetical protein
MIDHLSRVEDGRAVFSAIASRSSATETLILRKDRVSLLSLRSQNLLPFRK